MLTTRKHNERIWILREDGHVLGAVSYNGLRAYVFPLYTPRSVLALAETSADHLHHQGIMLGHGEVNNHDFWAAGSWEIPKNLQILLDSHVVEGNEACRIELSLEWRAVTGERLLREERAITFKENAHATVVDSHSRLRAAFGAIKLGKTKEAGYGMRVAAPLEAMWGGQIVNSAGAIGENETFDRNADWVAVHGKIAGNPVVVALIPLVGKPVPWFTRDYGLTTYNPWRFDEQRLERNEEVNIGVRVIACDGVFDPKIIDRFTSTMSS